MKHRPVNLVVPPCVKEASSESGFKVFYNKDQGDEGPAELLIFDEIGENWYGEGVSAEGVVDFCRQNRGREIHARINSFGGSAYEGMVIYNNLISHDADVMVTIEGIAYSAASFIAMAGDKVRMFKASDIGIHRASIMAWGNQHQMEMMRDWLAKLDDHLVDIYADRTDKDSKQLNDWLDGTSDGTIFSAAEAVEHGFADEIIDPKSDRKKAKDVRREVVKNFSNRANSRNRLAIQRLRSSR